MVRCRIVGNDGSLGRGGDWWHWCTRSRSLGRLDGRRGSSSGIGSRSLVGLWYDGMAYLDSSNGFGLRNGHIDKVEW